MTVSVKASQPNVEQYLSRADPHLGRLIATVVPRFGRQRITPSTRTPFAALVQSVTYQQLAGPAAAAIHGRLRRLVPGAFTPNKVVALTLEALRGIGLSNAKARYIRSIAEWFVAHPNARRQLRAMSDEQVTETLTGIDGIGPWTANVFLMFELGRPDVVPAQDLGIRKGVQLAYRLKEVPKPAFVSQIALRWRPHGSIASLYLWQAARLKLGASVGRRASTRLKGRPRIMRRDAQR